MSGLSCMFSRRAKIRFAIAPIFLISGLVLSGCSGTISKEATEDDWLNCYGLGLFNTSFALSGGRPTTSDFSHLISAARRAKRESIRALGGRLQNDVFDIPSSGETIRDLKDYLMVCEGLHWVGVPDPAIAGPGVRY